MNLLDSRFSRDRRVHAHRKANGFHVYGQDADNQRFDPLTGKDRDVSHLAEPSKLVQPAIGEMPEEDVEELGSQFPIFSPRSDWSGVKG